MRKIIALHGFLGLKADWDGLNVPGLHAIDLYQLRWDSLQECAKQLNERVQHEIEKPILVGYSLGGRLALHALIQSPALWQAAVIISAHPGLTNEEDKTRRVQSDQQWAKRFLEDDWTSVIEAWNCREVFANSSFKFKREEKDYHRHMLAHILDRGSLGRQEDLREALSSLSLPLLWLVGERDINYAELSASISLRNPQSRVVKLQQAGHRLPWEQPQQFKSWLHYACNWK